MKIENLKNYVKGFEIIFEGKIDDKNIKIEKDGDNIDIYIEYNERKQDRYTLETTNNIMWKKVNYSFEYSCGNHMCNRLSKKIVTEILNILQM